MTARKEFGSSLGVMQGRLSPMVFGGYQAFPTDLWEREFKLARHRNLQHIEWVLDAQSLGDNPILINSSDIGVCSRESSVSVVSVCADFLMDRPLDVSTGASWDTMERLLDAMTSLKATWVVIPCVDQSSVREHESRRRLVKSLHRLDELIVDSRICVALETDLPPADFADLLSEFDRDRIGVNYDIGNSASLGFDPVDELAAYGDRVNLLHVKDRILHGGSVRLGTGSANLPGVLSTLMQLGFKGPVTLQCFRDQEGLAAFDEQLDFYRHLIAELLDGS